MSIAFTGNTDDAIYFDRCIDLYFYQRQGSGAFLELGHIKTPEYGFKPSISIRGTFIEGSYGISTYISIENLSMNFDVSAADYILAHLYYKGVTTGISSASSSALAQGHYLFLPILYADQEKEPPTRAVRFQCSTASWDAAIAQSVVTLPTGNDAPTTLSGWMSLFISFYNAQFSKFYNVTGMSGQSKTLSTVIQGLLLDTTPQIDDVSYTDIVLDDKGEPTGNTTEVSLSDMPLSIKSSSDVTLRWLLQQFNMIGIKGVGSSTDVYFKVFIYNGALYCMQIISDKENDSQYSSKGSENAIPLCYVKGMYRNENQIFVTTLFDNRIRPGIYCKTSGNAIMGKFKATRFLSYKNKIVTFRIVGALEYQFGTVSGNLMNFQGVVVDSASNS